MIQECDVAEPRSVVADNEIATVLNLQADGPLLGGDISRIDPWFIAVVRVFQLRDNS